MGKENPSNPFSNDPSQTRKDLPMPISKAKVESAKDSTEGFHTVTIRVYGDSSPYVAPVIPFSIGSAWIPKPNTDVAVMFGANDKPWVIGPWYALDRVEDGEVSMPDYEPGEVIIGNEAGRIKIDNDGEIYINDRKKYSDEDAQDAVAAMLSGGTGISLTYDDSGDSLTIDGHSRYTDEEAQDAIGAALSAQFTYDDAGNVVNINPHENTSDAHHTRYSDEEAQDAVNALLTGGSNISLTYDDANNGLTIDTSALNAEEVDDRVNALLTAGTHLSASYDDTNNTLTLDVSDDWVDITGDTMSGALTVDGADLTVTGPDDAAGTVTFQPGSDTGATGTPSMNVNVDGTLDMNGNSISNIGEGSSIGSHSMTAMYNGTSNYGYYEVENNNGRGAYFGWGDGSGTVNLTLDNASTLKINGGDIDISGGTIEGFALEDQSSPALRAALDSSATSSQWVDMARLNDANGDNYRWHANLSNNEPFLVYNQTTSTRLLEVRDRGVRIKGNDAVVSSSGQYDIQKNGTDGTGIINFKT